MALAIRNEAGLGHAIKEEKVYRPSEKLKGRCRELCDHEFYSRLK